MAGLRFYGCWARVAQPIHAQEGGEIEIFGTSRLKMLRQSSHLRIQPHAVAHGIILLIVLLSSAGLPYQTFGKDYETPEPRTIEAALMPEFRTSPHDRIEEPVQHDGYMHTYTVDTDYGVFLAQSDAMLRRLRLELSTIADLRERYVAGVAAESAVKVVMKPVYALGRLTSAPADTLMGIPRGVYRMVESAITGSFRDAGPYEDSGMKSVVQVSAYKRRIAAYYHVDVYSSNPILQLELDRVAWASLAGYTTTFAMLLVPVPNPLPLALVSLNSVEVLNRALEEQGPDDLRLFNLRNLRSMGVSDELAEKFLDHPHYSPRHQTIIVSCLQALSQAKRRDRFVTVALNASSEEEALSYQHAAELLKAYDEQVLPILEITMLGRFPLGRSKERSAFLPAPIDYCIWTQKTEAMFDRLSAAIRHRKRNARIEVWFTGTVSPRARRELLDRRIVVKEGMDREIQLAD